MILDLPGKPQIQCHYENCIFVDLKYNVEINATFIVISHSEHM